MDALNLAILGWVIAIIGVVLAYFLARHGKRQDFRFDILQRAVSVFHRTSFLISLLDSSVDAAKNPEVLKTTGLRLEDLPDPLTTGTNLRSVVQEGVALSAVVDELFSKETHSHWTALLKTLQKIDATLIEQEGLKPARRELHRRWNIFVQAAGRECGLRKYGRHVKRFQYFATGGQEGSKDGR